MISISFPEKPQRFALYRAKDITGVSGVGIVATGCQFPDGTCAIRWNGKHASTAIYNSMFELTQIHGHNGATHILWIDELPDGVTA